MTALARSAQAGKTRIMRLLLDHGANVEARSVNGSTPLFYAAERIGPRPSACSSTAAPTERPRP